MNFRLKFSIDLSMKNTSKKKLVQKIRMSKFLKKYFSMIQKYFSSRFFLAIWKFRLVHENHVYISRFDFIRVPHAKQSIDPPPQDSISITMFIYILDFGDFGKFWPNHVHIYSFSTFLKHFLNHFENFAICLFVYIYIYEHSSLYPE